MKILLKTLKIIGYLCGVSVLTAAFLLLTGVWWGNYSRQKLEADQVREFLELKDQLFLDEGILRRDANDHNKCWILGKIQNKSPKILTWVEVRVEILQDHGKKNGIDHLEPVDAQYFSFKTEARPFDWKFFQESFPAKLLPSKFRFNAKISNARFEDSALVAGRTQVDLTGVEEVGPDTNQPPDLSPLETLIEDDPQPRRKGKIRELGDSPDQPPPP